MSGAAQASPAVDKRHPAVVAQQERLDRMRDDIFRLGLERNVVALDSSGGASPATTF